MMIDKVGYDVEAMLQLTEKEFIETHLPNDAICKGASDVDRRKYLKGVYGQLKATQLDKKSVAQ